MSDETKDAKPHGERKLRERLSKRYEALKNERSTWLTRWEDISRHMRPRGFRRHRSDVNSGKDRHGDIINFTPLEAARTLASGMMAGITSPSRPWFRLTVQGADEPGLTELPEVKRWLSEVQVVLREDMARSNLYKALHVVYLDIGPFGVACIHVDEDDEDGARAYVFPVGSYVLASSPRGDVDTVIREVSLTVDQLVRLFGEERCSEQVRRLHREGNLDERVDVCHAVGPNPEHREGAVGYEGKPWLSCWWEMTSGVESGLLRCSGYDERPFFAPRWETTGEDTYGHGPGFAALGDCRALQLLEKRAAQAADKVVSPPMAAPATGQNGLLNLVPGGTSFVDGLGAGQALRPALEVPPAAIEIFEAKIRQHEMRVRKAFYADLWLLLSEADREMTAREVSERREEKLLQLGTVLEALQDELLDPLIDRFFGIALRQGRIPPPPRALEGRPLKVEFISIMAAAQKLLATTGLERLATFTQGLSTIKPDAIDKLDFDQLVDEYADALGVPPATVRADKEVEQVRAERAEMQAQQQQAMAAQQAADTAKTLADIEMDGPSALNEMLRGVGVR